MWGRATDDEIRAARLLRQESRALAKNPFPPIDPEAPCPEFADESDSWIVVYRIRRGCLWSERAPSSWHLDEYEDDYRLDIERYYEKDPFIVYIHDGGRIETMAIVPSQYLALVEGQGYRCHREVSTYFAGGNVDGWAPLEALYRSPDIVQVAFFDKFPWYADVPECPRWVGDAPGFDHWEPPTQKELQEARAFQALFVNVDPQDWPSLPAATEACPIPEEQYGHDDPEVWVFRVRQGCLIASPGVAASEYSGENSMWEIYDYEADPWAIWACSIDRNDASLTNCGSDLPHNRLMWESAVGRW